MSEPSPIEAALGHTFADRALLERALTHTSYGHEQGIEDNQRLEFLGDAILQACAGILLFRRYPDAAEGKLTSMRQHVVSESALAGIGRRLDVGSLLRLGRGAASQGEHERDSVISDAVEALLGAVFEDAGFDPCLRIVESWADAILANLDQRAVELGRAVWTHPWNRLQELTQARWKVTPQAVEVSRQGPPDMPVVEVAVTLDGRTIARAAGRSRKVAMKEAAVAALEVLATIDDLDTLGPG